MKKKEKKCLNEEDNRDKWQGISTTRFTNGHAESIIIALPLCCVLTPSIPSGEGGESTVEIACHGRAHCSPSTYKKRKPTIMQHRLIEPLFSEVKRMVFNITASSLLFKLFFVSSRKKKSVSKTAVITPFLANEINNKKRKST